ncbi:MAG: hypothetical protein HZB71_13560 [Betaproteobacteria bacterium]|nr:hypothetical protein [Betaproteobacteria bacterium]
MIAWLPRFFSLPVLAAVVGGLWLYPYAQGALAVGLTLCAAIGLWRPVWLLTLIPAWLALVNLAPWSGSVFLEDFDLALGAALFVFLARARYTLDLRMPAGRLIFLLLFLLSCIVSISRGLYPLPDWEPVELSSYYSRWSALRMGKSFLWALLLLPGVAALMREDRALALRHLVWGLALGGAAVGGIALWERGVFNAIVATDSLRLVLYRLLDFTSNYRITGLFSEMNAGGEAIDGFMALTWCFGLLAAAGSRSWRGMAAGGAFFALALYALVTTFSRASYLGLLTGAAAGAALLVMRRRAGPGGAPLRFDANSLPGLLAPLTLALAYGKGGIIAVLAGLLAWGGALLAAYLARQRHRAAWLGLGVGALFLGLLGMSHAMETSRWVANESGDAFLLAAALCLINAAGGGWAGHRLAPLLNPRALIITLVAVAVGLGVVLPAAFGALMGVRMQTAGKDVEKREHHWVKAIEMMSPELDATLFGEGVGRFPARYLWSQGRTGTGIGEDMGSYQFQRDEEGRNLYLAMGGGQDARVTQRVPLPAGRSYTLSLKVKTDDPQLWLRLRLYRRNVVMLEDGMGQAVNFERTLTSTQGQWVTVAWNFKMGALGEDGLTARLPLVLEVMNLRKYDYTQRAGTVALIDEVSLKDQYGEEWIANGDFSRGMERWFPHFDFNHMPWHIKNLWVNIYFDQGALGALALAGLFFTVLAASVQRARRGDLWGVATAAALVSFLTVGLFGGLLDMPRVMFLCFLLLLASALSGARRTPKQPHGHHHPHHHPL